MKLLYVISDGYSEFNSSNLRARIPVNAINQSGEAEARIIHSAEWLQQSQRVKQWCSWADIISLQRIAIFESIGHIETWRNKGKVVVVDFDDAYQLIRDDNASYDFWGKGILTKTVADGVQYENQGANPVDQFRVGVSKVSGIVTPSKLLCRDWARQLSFGAHSLHIPNYIEPNRYKEPFSKNRTIIGWGGSLSHMPSWTESGIIPALYRLMKRHTDLHILIVGDNRVVDELAKLLPRQRIMYHPYVSWREWPEMLRLFDVGVAPLAGEYDCRRSDLKVSEYIASALPFVATSSAVYERYNNIENSFVDQGDGDKCDTPNSDGWQEQLEMIIDNLDYRKERSQKIKRDYWATYSIDDNVYNILDKYRKLL